MPAFQRSYHCRCGRAVFFRNTRCLSCGAALGYEPRLGRVVPLAPGAPVAQTDSEPEIWRLDGPGYDHAPLYTRCANLQTAAACNWLVPANAAGAIARPYCVSCRLTRTVPDLSDPENARLWRLLEDAKRQVISALVVMGLPLASRVGEDPERELAFDFLKSPEGGPRVGAIGFLSFRAAGGSRAQIAFCAFGDLRCESAGGPSYRRTRERIGFKDVE